MRILLVISTLLIATGPARAAGYDDSYRVLRGDFNSDGRMDLYIGSLQTTPIAVGDVRLHIGPPVREVVLLYNNDGTFTQVTALTPAQRASVRQWPQADIDHVFFDADMDGRGDLQLVGVAMEVPGAFDQILLSGETWGAPPKHIIARTRKFNSYVSDVSGVLRNPNYFDINAPYRVVGAEPPSRGYYGGILRAGDFTSTSLLLSWCRADYPRATCNLSQADPSPCVRTMDLFNDQGQYIGTQTRNVCDDYIHVFVYIPGSVQLQPDYSVFDQDARETKEVVDRLRQNCDLFTPNSDTLQLERIVERVFGTTLEVSGVGDRFLPNSTGHPPAPGDGEFSRADPTFHHYDTRTKLCSVGQTNCNVTAAHSEIGLRLFTHPSLRLRPLLTPIDGSPVTAHIPSLPALVHLPAAYTDRIGDVTQRMVSSGYWAGAVQNVTMANHGMHPGTVTRKVFQEGNSLYIRTHGIGVNRFYCVGATNPLLFSPALQVVRALFAMVNDVFGAETFKTVDRVFVADWRFRHAYPQARKMTLSTGAAVMSKGSP